MMIVLLVHEETGLADDDLSILGDKSETGKRCGMPFHDGFSE